MFPTSDSWLKSPYVHNCREPRKGRDIEAHEFLGKARLMANNPEPRFVIVEFLEQHAAR